MEEIYPPGIRFHPSDEELISFYLQRKIKSLPLPPNVITDINLYGYDPWDLPRNGMFGDEELYFFTPRERKYPNGGRPNRAAASGYWKATGTDQPIRSSLGSRKIGVKKGLVFYKGKPPNGLRMDWVMTEYRLPDTSRPTGSMRLDDWVLCRIRHKGNMSKNESSEEQAVIRTDRNRDMLSDYLKSNEYNLIVSLLAGGHHPAPTSIYQNRATEAEETEQQMQQTGSAFQSGASAMTDAGLYVCRPRYASNAGITLQEIDMLPPLQHSFLH